MRRAEPLAGAMDGRQDPDEVEIISDVSPMATFTAW